MTDILNMTVPGKPEYVATVRMTAAALAMNAGFDIEAIEDIKVAISEACTNIILHGDEPGTSEELHLEKTKYEVRFEIDGDELSIYVEDHGVGYDPGRYTDPVPGEIKSGGLGIFIVKTLMDEVDIRSQIGAGTYICMKKYRRPASAAV
ncbi:MAG: ATP-binding protein [Clostridiales bacterium]|nr:ATP-binding protein [Clostridiales bacterium]